MRSTTRSKSLSLWHLMTHWPGSCLFLSITLVGLVLSAPAQTSSIAYQGQLADGGVPANGSYDFQFKVFNHPSAGSQISSTLTKGNLDLSNGLFTVTLDFGTNVFDGGDRWLAVSVRPGDSTGAYSNLLPRQPILSTPYSLRALNAGFAIAAATATTAGTAGAAVNATTAGLATNAFSAQAFTDPLAGDVIGTQGATVVSKVAGQSAASVASGAIAANAATSANTPDAIVKRDASGSVAVGNISALGVTGDGSELVNLNGANLAAASVAGDQLTPGAALANLNQSGLGGVASGSILLSAIINDDKGGPFRKAGYVRIGGTLTCPDAPDAWQQVKGANGGPAQGRDEHTAVWSGSEMLMWGGHYFNGSHHYLNNGLRFDPQFNTWRGITLTGAPIARGKHTAVWTGTKMIIWGGHYNDGTDHFLRDGAMYDPGAGTWSAINPVGAPSARSEHTANWTGTKMIVWGGRFNDGTDHFLNDGAVFDPVANTWSPLPFTGAPTARCEHTAVWSGKEMIIWGGRSQNGNARIYPSDGASYDTTSGWKAISTIGAPVTRARHTAVWTGDQMLIWGGDHAGDGNVGGCYDLAADRWTPMNTNGAPSPRTGHTAVWTGTQMVVWGGGDNDPYTDGARYNPAGNSWSPSSTVAAPAARAGHAAVWTGTAMLVWGGGWTADPNSSGTYYVETYSYTPGSLLYLYQR